MHSPDEALSIGSVGISLVRQSLHYCVYILEEQLPLLISLMHGPISLKKAFQCLYVRGVKKKNFSLNFFFFI